MELQLLNLPFLVDNPPQRRGGLFACMIIDWPYHNDMTNLIFRLKRLLRNTILPFLILQIYSGSVYCPVNYRVAGKANTKYLLYLVFRYVITTDTIIQ